jgi:hypothetical protein
MAESWKQQIWNNHSFINHSFIIVLLHHLTNYNNILLVIESELHWDLFPTENESRTAMPSFFAPFLNDIHDRLCTFSSPEKRRPKNSETTVNYIAWNYIAWATSRFSSLYYIVFSWSSTYSSRAFKWRSSLNLQKNTVIHYSFPNERSKQTFLRSVQ